MRVLLVWELGGQLGHFGTLLPIADALAADGHEVVFALKDLGRAPALIGLRYRYLQAPLWTDAKQAARRYDSFADILLHAGFDHASALGGLVAAWRALYAQVRPDWVVYDYAPVALFAARGLPFRKTCVGTGFSVPPGDELFPRFRHWLSDTASDLAHRQGSHQMALANGNRVARQLGMPALESLPDVFGEAVLKFATLPPLDHYSSRVAGDYIGPISGLGQDEPFQKKDGEHWIFCYLWARHRGSLELLKALADNPDFKTLAVVPDLSGPAVARQHKNLTITRQPVDLRTLSHWAELLVCHAGHGALVQASSQGVPTVSRPVTLEQTLLARRVEAAGAGITLQGGITPDAAARQIADAVSQQTGKAGAQRIRTRYQSLVADSANAILAALA